MSAKPKSLRQQQQQGASGASLRALRPARPASMLPPDISALSKVEQRVGQELALQQTVMQATAVKAAFGAEVVRDVGRFCCSLEIEAFDDMQAWVSAPHDPAVQDAVKLCNQLWQDSIHDSLGEVYASTVAGVRQIVGRSLYPAPPPPKRGLWSRLRGKEE